MAQKKNDYIIPLAIIGMMFFIVGFALGINSYIVPLLQGALNVSSGQSYLLLASTFAAFLLFSYPATALITKVGYKKTMVLSFAIFAFGFLLFVPSAKMQSLPLFMIASFICGIGNTVLQAAINPYATYLGPIDTAARRISIMGICNIIAWPASPMFLAWLIGKNLDEMVLSDIVFPFYVLTGIFVLLGLLVWVSPLKEMAFGEQEEEGGDASEAEGKTSIFQFPHLILGALALFMYVGVETIAMASSVDYAAELKLPNPEQYAFIPSIGMILGYIFGIIMIPKFLSQSGALRVHSWIAIAGTLAVVLLPEQYSIYAVAVVTFGCSVMYPAIFPLAVKGLGKFADKGSSILVACIAGGSVVPLAYGFLKDWVGGQAAYWIGIPCFVFILFYAYYGYKMKGKVRK
jgi:fucose permease